MGYLKKMMCESMWSYCYIANTLQLVFGPFSISGLLGFVVQESRVFNEEYMQ